MKSRPGATRMTALRSVVLAGLALCFSRPVLGAGPWVPFVAQRIAKTYRLSASGKTLIRQESDVWLRNSAGSLYLRLMPLSGSFPPAEKGQLAILFDASTGTTYLINYAAKWVRVTRKAQQPLSPPSPASFQSHMPQSRFIAQRAIAGVQCLGWKMVWGDSVVHTRGEPSGEMWYAPSLNYAPLASVIIDPEGGAEIDTQVVSIQPGQEPDPALFQLPPPGFRMVD